MLPATRMVSAAIVPFLLVAFVVLYGAPKDTGRWFAWQITPSMTSMVLGSVYLGGAYFFTRAVRASHWHTVKAGFVPVTLFASLMGVATIVHWDRFNHGHVAFWLWAGLYFTTPLLVFGVWLANRGRDRRAAAEDLLVSPGTRLAAGVIGVAALGFGLLLFLQPGWAVDVWPWSLTPLTARVFGATFCLGAAGLGIFVDPRWSTARLMVQVQGLMLLLVLGAVFRARAEFDVGNPLRWLFAGGFLGLLAGSAVVWVRMEARRRGLDRANDEGLHREPRNL
ncbi:MAG: hypothetical protein ACRDTT_10000 [Pseudonocardiaceae bacterium]